MAQANSEDTRITNPMSPAPDSTAEVDQATLDAVNVYIRMLAVPARGVPLAESRAGEPVFLAAGYTTCHTPSLQTHPSPISALAHETMYLYSDLLLHDMGEDLADGRPDFEATGAEW